MKQAKISFSEEQIQFINMHSKLGFKDKSELVRKAISEFQKEIEAKQLAESAQLYSEVYKSDEENKQLTDSAINDWPE